MRSLIVYADGGPANAARLEAALDIARLTRGHITLHVNTPLQRFVSMDPFGGSYLLAGALADAEQRESELLARLTEKLRKEEVPWDSQTSSGLAADGLVGAAMLGDLIILSFDPLDAKPQSDATRLVGDVVLSAPCPVLALPAEPKPLFIGGTALIAWSGEPESAGAVRAALPLLALAKAVKIVTVVDHPAFFPAIDAAQYLSRHDIHAELVEWPREPANVGLALAAAADALDADWVVMGAYGKGRFREAMFGGVTQKLLDLGRFPLLLSH
ncbi:MAG: universal stress protein [Sphingomonas sp.]|nr:universal stress protein [Sphingomonas sp.]